MPTPKEEEVNARLVLEGKGALPACPGGFSHLSFA